MENVRTKHQWFNALSILLLVMLLSSAVTLLFGKHASVDFDLKPKLSQQLGTFAIGHVQTINTRLIGPLTLINLKFFKAGEQLVSANAFQFFWFEPKITCASTSPDHICH